MTRHANTDRETRPIPNVVDAIRTVEGAGFSVRRAFPTRLLADIDPFLLLDEMGPADLAPGEAKGAPDHPHRGFETVTYMLDGEMQHKDSHGNAGRLKAGDVQWMTAGAGVIHAEMPGDAIMEKGGRMHGFQLWVNLPRRDKMMKPRYQEIPGTKIPSAMTPDGLVKVKVIAGEALGVKAVIDTRTPILYHHYTISPSGKTTVSVPAGFNTFAYVFSGKGNFAERRAARDGQVVIFSPGSGSIRFENPAENKQPLDALLIGGVPLKEPIVRYGPFVMNTQEEIAKAIDDYQAGRLGKINF